MIPGYRRVPGDGPLDAKVMIVGESPGEQESYRGQAFIDPSGELLWPLLQHYMQLWRAEVYVTNLVKLNTWGREEDSKKKEKAMLEGIARDGPELMQEILTVKPTLILGIGRWSISWLLKKSVDAWMGEFLSAKELRRLTIEVVNGIVYGRHFVHEGLGFNCAVVGMLHPANPLRGGGSQLQLLSWAMMQAADFLNGDHPPVPVIRQPYRSAVLLQGYQVPDTGSECMGLDTEGSARRPKCITVSSTDNIGYAVEVGDTIGLHRVALSLLDAREIVSHHKLHDLPVYRALGIDLESIIRMTGAKLVDTMIAAHQLGGAGDDEDTSTKNRGKTLGIEPLGLKPLALRHMGIVMQTYKGLVQPYVAAARWRLLEALLPYFPPEQVISVTPKTRKTRIKLVDQKAAKLIRSALKSRDQGKNVNLEGRFSKLTKKKGKREPEPNTWMVAGIPSKVKELGWHWPNDSTALVDNLVPVEEWVPYACDDATLARLLWLEYLKPRLETEGLLRPFELNMARLPLIDKMRCRGMHIDLPAEKQLLVQWKQEISDCDEAIRVVFGKGPEFNPGAPPQVSQLLFQELNIPSVKQTRKGQDSTAGDVLESIQQYHPMGISLLVRRRDTDTQLRFVKEGKNARNSRLHADISMVRTVSDRLASSDPNFLAWPKHGPRGKAIRRVYTATPGYVILEMDYSQIELRVFAHRSGEPSMVEAFRSGKDIHRMTAELILGDKSEEARQICKTTNFAILYLCSPPTLMAQLNANEEVKVKKSLDECEWIQRAWHQRFPGASSHIQQVREQIIRAGEIRDSWGGRRYLPGAKLQGSRWPCRSFREEAIRQGNNYVIQTDSQREISEAMVVVDREVLPQFYPGDVYPLLQIHDALLMEVRIGLEEKLYWMMKAAMERNSHKYQVPILVDGKLGDSWGGLEKYAPKKVA